MGIVRRTDFDDLIQEGKWEDDRLIVFIFFLLVWLRDTNFYL